MDDLIIKQIAALLEEEDMIAALSNVSACIKENMDRLNWAGFYFVKNGELVLGPFQGKAACTHIPFDKGVCGKCYREKTVQRIDDVLSFPGHIACDSQSRSELCVPVIVNGEMLLEIDLDSPFENRFTEEDEKRMSAAAAEISLAFSRHSWKVS